MTHTLLAQAIKLPGANDSSVPIAYPNEFKGFLFEGPKGTIGNIINTALPIILGIAGLALLLMIIFSGFTMMTSAGDAKKMEQGKQRLTNAIIGFIIIFGAYWAIQIVGIMFGTSVTTGFN